MNGVNFRKPEGIYESAGFHRIRCTLCGKEMNNSPLPRAAHGKKHVRAGEAVERRDLSSYDGPRSIYERATGSEG